MRLTRVFKKRSPSKVDSLAERRIPAEWLYDQSEQPVLFAAAESHADKHDDAVADRCAELDFESHYLRRRRSSVSSVETGSSVPSRSSCTVSSSFISPSPRGSWCTPSPSSQRACAEQLLDADSPLRRHIQGATAREWSPGLMRQNACGDEDAFAPQEAAESEAEPDPQWSLPAPRPPPMLRQHSGAPSFLSLPRTVSTGSLDELWSTSDTSSNANLSPLPTPLRPALAGVQHAAPPAPLALSPQSAAERTANKHFHSLPTSLVSASSKRPTSLLHARSLARAAEKELRKSFKDNFMLDLGGKAVSLAMMPSPRVELQNPLCVHRHSASGAGWI
ncbi:hypothetical protein K437DRAFT_255844 [Tilletiaria anomala UBC 951]|uniref:Uncharacterized protein n=1 Tax=Tilletiaria anomala (strain ATCC 24038 / CBS 436.72 / UBC 951) TaxID=1037660 RepID=A0A066W9V1_TILAU|nr:uncharacterized protein K437DRAFT_255844 [Tilletiaria anomala UBC 951]KDN47565.1 hypothetical protein K437DRAFT_255844 [Tilletiaria anomala UBC 951]